MTACLLYAKIHKNKAENLLHLMLYFSNLGGTARRACGILKNMLYYSLLMRHRQAVRQGTLTPPSQVRLLLAQLHKRPARKLRFSKSCRSFCVQKQEWGTASEPSPLEKHLAGVAFSCISQGESPCRYHRRVAATKLTTSNAFLILCIAYHSYSFL